MPFISNDEKFSFIGDDEAYDASKFYVVRKLYVKMEPMYNTILSNEIADIFKKYGPLENVHVQVQHSSIHAWAYVTFCNDKDACLAMFVEKSQKNGMISDILPAHTSEQPPSTVQTFAENALELSNREEPSLLMLNDDCLLKIFGYCDMITRLYLWKVCQRARNLIDNFVLPKRATYELHFGRYPMKLVSRVREELKLVGLGVTNLLLASPCEKNFIPDFDLYLLQCSEYVGRSLKKLKLSGISYRYLKLIQPLLLNIESLSIRFITEENHKILFDIQIPKLKQLKLNKSFNAVPMNTELLKNEFPNLERAIFASSFSNDILEMFLSNHPQLHYLRINRIDGSFDGVIGAIAAESINLKELVLHNVYLALDLGGTGLVPLISNEKLTKLVLYECSAVNYRSGIGKVLSDLRKLVHLRSIVVTTLRRYEHRLGSDAFINLGCDIPYLEHFCSDFAWNLSTIIEFIKRARHLKTFCVIRYESVCPTIDFIKTLVEARKSIFGNGSDGMIVMDLIIVPREYHPPTPGFTQLELDAEMANYVSVSFLKSSAEKQFGMKFL